VDARQTPQIGHGRRSVGGAGVGGGDVGGSVLKRVRALLFANYLNKHADRIYASVSGHDHAAVRMLADRLLGGQLKDGFTCRTLTLKGWAGIATKEQAQAAIDALVEYDWLIETETRSGSRPTVKYSLKPNVTADLL
jgi:putative DNA primase/helicase